MKVLFYTGSFKHGGAERVMSILANGFVRIGHEVYIIQNDELKDPAYRLDPKVLYLSLGGLRFNRVKSFVNPLRKLRSFLKQKRPDVIISFFPDTVLFAKIMSFGTHIPIVFSERNDPKQTIRGWKMNFFQHFAIRNCDWLVFQTSMVRNYYKNYSSKSSVILNPCEASQFSDLKIIERKKQIVSVGRLEPQKNHRILIEAFDRIADEFSKYSLVIYGDGSLREDLYNLILSKKREDRIYLPGVVDNVASCIYDCSVFVLSSDFEGLPNALIEAMVLGIPCISTDCSPGGARELINNESNGLLVPCKDVDKLSEAIRFMLKNPLDAERMGREAKCLKEKTSPDSVVNQWMDVIQKVL